MEFTVWVRFILFYFYKYCLGNLNMQGIHHLISTRARTEIP